MNPVAIHIGSTVIYWSSLVIALGIAACFFISLALYTSYAGGGGPMWMLLPLAVIFSVVLSRLIHWYCHIEQYPGLLGALTDYSAGGYCLPGAIVGTVLAALLVGRLGFTDNVARLLDAIAPGAALGIAFIRLSALFNYSCRGKITVKTPALQRLPLASPVYSGGLTDYRFATFFVQFIIMLILFVLIFRFYLKHRNSPMKGDMSRDGHTAMVFLLYYSAIEVVMDSTRYDSSFLQFNGFVSIVQIFAGVCILAIFVYYTVMAVRVNGKRFKQILLWVLFLIALGGAGYSEYMVQRHGDWYLGCYTAMSLCMVLLSSSVFSMYKSCRRKKRKMQY